MKAAKTLPLIANDPEDHNLRIHAPLDSTQRTMPRVEMRAREGAVLHASPMSADPRVLSLNLARGCVHRCSFCSIRANPSYPGDGVVQIYSDTAERLQEELSALENSQRHTPRAVYISPSTDPFPPLTAVQEETGRVVEVLARHGIESWLMTRGYIRPALLGILESHRELVKITVGLITADRSLQRLLEPLAAPPRTRLRQIDRLQELGIEVHVALEPLVPGLTDTRTNLLELLEAVAAIGVRHITAGYMFLRQGIRDNLIRVLEPYGWDQRVLDAFKGGPILESPGIAPARYLPKSKRQHSYAALMALAAGLGISVRIDRVTNPDFLPPRRLEADPGHRQLLLPIF